MDRIFEAIEEWMRESSTVGMVSSNLTTMYTDVTKRPVRLLLRLGRHHRAGMAAFTA